MAEEAAAPAAAAKDGAAAPKKGGPVPMIAGGAVIFILGAAGAWFAVKSLLAPPADEKKEEAKHEEKHESLLHSAKEFILGDIMSNVRGQGGRRYIKMHAVVWVGAMAGEKIGVGGGGHGGGGGTEVKRIVQAHLEEHLKSYDLDDLTGPNIYKQLEKGFADIIEREVHALFPDLPPEEKVVKRVVLTNLLVQ